MDSNDTPFTKIQGSFAVTDSPGIAAYIEDVVTNEGDGSATVVVTLSRASSSEVTLDYQTTDGTALAGEDYTTTSGTLTIAAGETSGNFSIPITDDSNNEALESFSVNFSNAVNATLGKTSTKISIEDNDAASTNSVSIEILAPGSSDIDVTPIILKPTPGGFNQEEAISDYGIQLEGEYETITLPEEVDKIQIEEGQAKQDIIDLHEANEILVDVPFEDDILVVSYDL